MTTYTVNDALNILRSAGAHVSRQLYYQSLEPVLVADGVAVMVAPQRWQFDDAGLQRWAGYLAELQRRKKAGTAKKSMPYSIADCHAWERGEWELEQLD